MGRNLRGSFVPVNPGLRALFWVGVAVMYSIRDMIRWTGLEKKWNSRL